MTRWPSIEELIAGSLSLDAGDRKLSMVILHHTWRPDHKSWGGAYTRPTHKITKSLLPVRDKNHQIPQRLPRRRRRERVQNIKCLLAVLLHDFPGIFQPAALLHE